MLKCKTLNCSYTSILHHIYRYLVRPRYTEESPKRLSFDNINTVWSFNRVPIYTPVCFIIKEFHKAEPKASPDMVLMTEYRMC